MALPTLPHALLTSLAHDLCLKARILVASATICVRAHHGGAKTSERAAWEWDHLRQPMVD